MPDTSYGINSVQFEKGLFAYPGDWTSGGIQGVSLPAQMQTVFIYSATATAINGVNMFSGSVRVFDPIKVVTPGGIPGLQKSGLYHAREFVWAVERNNYKLNSGEQIGGQFVGYSALSQSGFSDSTPVVAPVYLINRNVPEVRICRLASTPDVNGVGTGFTQFFRTPNTYSDDEAIVLVNANRS